MVVEASLGSVRVLSDPASGAQFGAPCAWIRHQFLGSREDEFAREDLELRVDLFGRR
jgi:hypothetical protein